MISRLKQNIIKITKIYYAGGLAASERPMMRQKWARWSCQFRSFKRTSRARCASIQTRSFKRTSNGVTSRPAARSSFVSRTAALRRFSRCTR